MKGMFIMMVLVIIAFFLWIRYQLSIPGSGEWEMDSHTIVESTQIE